MGQCFRGLHGFRGHLDDPADAAENILFVVQAVRVADDVALVVAGDAVLVNDPFEGAAVAEADVWEVWEAWDVWPPKANSQSQTPIYRDVAESIANSR